MSNKTVLCYPLMQAVSDGIVQGDNPIDFALSLLVIQIAIVIIITRAIALIIRPLHQPRVLGEVIGGVLLGPSGLGRNTQYLNNIFPKNSLVIIDTMSTIGLLFYLFMVGLELDLKELKRSGKAAFITAISGIALPFVSGVGMAKLIQETLNVDTKFSALVVFMGVPLSITAFPVLVRVMAERKLLGTEIGKKALPAAAFNDVCAWVMLAVGVSISGPSQSPLVPLYVLIGGCGFVLFMLFFVRRIMEDVAQRSIKHGKIREIYVCLTMLGVLLSGFATDIIGIHPLFGAFMFGVIVPRDGDFARLFIEKIEDFVTVLMLPLFFASSGLKTNLGSINSGKSVGILFLLLLVSGFAKISATVVCGLAEKMNLRTAFAFGFLMNTKGLVELIVLNIGKDLGVFNDQLFAILVIMCLIMLFITTPAVAALFKPARNPIPYNNRKLEGTIVSSDELRILTCVHGTKGIPAILNLVETWRAMETRPVKLYVMRLIELHSHHTSTHILRFSRAFTHIPHEDNPFVAFEEYKRHSKVPVKMSTSISDLDTMHEDICKTALERRTNMIILPFDFRERADGLIEYIYQGFQKVNQNVLEHSPCSVGIFVGTGLWSSPVLSRSTSTLKIALLFFGGKDDREAFAFAMQLGKHPRVRIVVVRFIVTSTAQPDSERVINITKQKPQSESAEEDRKSDEKCLAVLKGIRDESVLQSMNYEEHAWEGLNSMVEMVKAREFSLVLAGQGSHAPLEAKERSTGNSELGIVGDALARAIDHDMQASLLVIQQHNHN